MSRRAFPILLLAAAGLAGCAVEGRPIVPVKGVVTRDGKPVASLFLNFMPEAGRPSWGQTDENGAFTLHYDHRDGAEVGAHKVFVRFRPASPKEEMDVIAGRKKYHPDQKAIEAKYGSAETTPLTVEVKSGGDPLTIALD